jgi:hypothetical protein
LFSKSLGPKDLFLCSQNLGSKGTYTQNIPEKDLALVICDLVILREAKDLAFSRPRGCCQRNAEILRRKERGSG